MKSLSAARAIIAIWFFTLVPALAACDSPEPTPTVEATTVAEASPTEAPATDTPEPTATTEPTQPPPDTATPRPTRTSPPATATPEESPTPEGTPTETPSPEPSPTNTRPPATAGPTRTSAPPTLPPNPTLGQNLLPNASFEEGHFNQNGIPELQLPNGWRLDYQEGATGFGGQAWDVYVRPETRVLSSAFLPPEEHGLYIFDGAQTVKIFKGQGAVSTRLMTDLTLQPGTYVLEANFFSDVFESYSNGSKNPPGDPHAGEAMLFAGGTGTGWIGNSYLARNTLTHTFTINSAQTITVGVGFRGRFAIANNGWFVDNLSLRQLQ